MLQPNTFKPQTILTAKKSGFTLGKNALFLLIVTVLLVAVRSQDCPNLPNTDGTAAVNGECTCLASDGNIYWDSNSGKCLVICSSYINNDEVDDVETCNCNAGFTWLANSTFIGCIADCSNDINAEPKVANPDGTCSCRNGSKFQFNNAEAKCTIQCGNIDNAVNTDPYNCTCLPPTLTWSYDNLNCTLNCSLVDNASSSTPNANGECDCVTHYTWNGASGKCELDCYTVEHTDRDNIAGNNATFCVCSNNYVWNLSAVSCDLNCTGIEFADAIASEATAPGGVCICTEPYSWNFKKVICDINCKLKANADQDPDVIDSNTNASACICLAGYEWIGSNFSCTIICNMDKAIAAVDENSCNCSIPYSWDAATSTCKLNCSLDPGSTGIEASSTSCACKVGLFWNDTNSACSYDCSQIVYTVTPPVVSYACTCQDKFFWNQYVAECIIDCSLYSNSKGVNTDFSSCSCKKGFTWQANAEGVMDSSLLGCVLNCGQVDNANGTVNATTCSCSLGYVWDAASSSCKFNCNI